MKNKLNSPREKTGLLLAAFSLLFLLNQCALPRVIVLKDPLTPEEHLNLGVSYEKKGEWDQAVKEYLLASKKLPLAFLYLGNVYFLKKDWTEAEKYYREAIQKDPENADAYNNLAWLYVTQGEQLPKAESLALKALELDPSKESVYRHTLTKILEKKSSSGRP